MNNSIYGMIGYTILVNDNKRVLVIADMHDKLNPCTDDYVTVGKWLLSKFNTSDILLEEVERNNNELQELWTSSTHTQELKNLYLNNLNIIIPIDIRHLFIPYSWELFNINEKSHDIKMYEYLEFINSFFTLKNKYLQTKLDYFNQCVLKNTNLGTYYLEIKNKYIQFINKNKDNLRIPMNNLNRQLIFEELNDILNNILEWYAISKIIYSNKSSIIIHTGLAHSEEIINILIKHFNFTIKHIEGINKLTEINEINEINMKSCFRLPTSMQSQFGGYYNE